MSSLRFSPSVDIAVHTAAEFAKKNSHEFVTTEHLAWALLKTAEVKKVLESMSAPIESLSSEIQKAALDAQFPTTQITDVSMSDGCLRILRNSANYAANQGASSKSTPILTPVLVLLGILEETETMSAFLLAKSGVTPLKLKTFLSRGPRVFGADLQLPSPTATPQDPPRSALEQFGVNLNARASAGRIDRLIGRIKEVERTAMILSRHRKNNPLLVGEPGVGKTAIAEGIAKMIVDGSAPEAIRDKVIWSVSMSALVAGTKFRGDFEQRIKDVIDEVTKDPDIILFIDEIHTMIGAGSTGASASDAANILKPALSSGDMRVIGSTTFQEYREIFEKDKALDRRFQKVDVLEPSPDETVEILKGLRPVLEKHHGVKYATPALRAAVDLAGKYITDKFFPDKAIDILDEAGAAERMKPAAARRSIDVTAVAETVSRIARIPISRVSGTEKEQVKDLAANIRAKIFGQDAAVDKMVASVLISKAGLGREKRPLGSFLLSGPTGVGKTEIVNQLAENMGLPIKRFDMSEYQEAHTVSRLVGAPPGYVGHEKSGLLTEAVVRTPHCVILLDEIEKAHPDVYNVLLQVLDNGMLTDANGRAANFRNVYVIMTTNAGAQQVQKNGMGFTPSDRRSEGTQILNATFSPEFRNRLDAVIDFNPLGPNEMRLIVDKGLQALSANLAARGVSLSLSDAAKDKLAKDGFDKAMGARPMDRLIREVLTKPLSEKILFGELENGGLAHVDVDDGGALTWTIQPKSAADPKRKRKAPAP